LQIVLSIQLIEKEITMTKLLSIGTNPKTEKSDKRGQFLTAIQYLVPSEKLCPFAKLAGCMKPCLFHTGNPIFMPVKLLGRQRRTELYQNDRPAYKQQLTRELEAFVRLCDRLGLLPACRLNGTSDVVWEKVFPELFDRFPQVAFYDYTKIAKRVGVDWKLPSNYNLTLSYYRAIRTECFDYLERGGRVAIVFGGYGRSRQLPSAYCGYGVEDGDTHDLTFIRTPGEWIGLRAKGNAMKSNQSGMVVRPVAEERHAELLELRGVQW
jgi:hypothetical protein